MLRYFALVAIFIAPALGGLSAIAADVAALTVIHDGSVDPPGFRLEPSLRLAPGEDEAEITVRVLRVADERTMRLEPVASSRAQTRDATGRYQQRQSLRSVAGAVNTPRLATADTVIAYDDLPLADGEQKLVFQMEVRVAGKPTEIVTSDVVPVTISNRRRMIDTPASSDDLQRWQVSPQIPQPPRAPVEPRQTPRQIARGFDSEANDPRQRQFLAQAETVDIQFATNRGVNRSLAPTTRANFFFTSTIEELTFGHCRVQVLRRAYEQKKAVQGRPLSFGELQNYFAVLETRFDEPADFGAGFRKQDVLLYIHGYDNSFEDALLRTAQLQLDLRFPGVSMAFAWPSLAKQVVKSERNPDDGRLAYYDDQKAADASAAALVELLQKLVESGAPGRRIHIIAHSMGGRVVLGAARQLAASGASRVLDQVVLAAPDVAVHELDEAEADLAKIAGRASVYASRKDVALLFSSKINALLDALLAERAGSVLKCYPSCDSISADLVNSYFSMSGGHSYFAEAPQMIHDLHLLICLRLPPEARSTLRSKSCSTVERQSWELMK